MADVKPIADNLNTKNGNFICGVVEGFYGRPWTTEQRKDLFQKLKKWGMDSYLYAPKDDYKHRAYWRELYTVEEAEHLTSLISSAKEHGITFYYAISPGLDITYSSAKEVTALKRKLEQVSHFGCTAFALLFDDIEPEMSEADKEVFQSFAHAQVSVTNEMYQHLGQPTFLLCPTQYCAARATPNVANSEYLNTLGAKLPQEIDIMWTGPKVISRTLTMESIEEITEVLRRPPVIWDNLHANDYDQKRVFLGPYSGRSPDLIPKLRGVLTNPNCEYGANFIAIHTLAQWSRCNIDAIRDHSLNDTVSADIKLETEGVSEEGPCGLSPNMYHPRRALRNAINDWLPEFKKFKPAWGPIAKPQQVIAAPVPIPIIPSVNTCMSFTATTMTTNSVPVPIVNANQLQALAEVCSTVQTNESLVQPTSVSVMNSLALESKVLPLPGVKNGKSGNQEPMDCNPTPGGSPGSPANASAQIPDVSMTDSPATVNSNNSTMQVESSSDDTVSSSTTQMVVDGGVGASFSDENPEPSEPKSDKELTTADLNLLCDLFYLPFEHGGSGVQLLQEFHWLKTNAHVLTASNRGLTEKEIASNKPEVEEWYERAKKFQETTNSVNTLFQRLTFCANRELLYDLYPYVWDMRGVVSLLNSYVKWLGFSKGWKEAFMSGEQEPWVFRGGLTADLQRLLPVDSGTDLFMYKAPEVPSSKIYTVRPYIPTDRDKLYNVCAKTYCVVDIPENLKNLPGDKVVGGYLEHSSELCLVVEDETEIVGFAVAALDSRQFRKKLKQSYITQMKEKYPLPKDDVDSKIKEMIEFFHKFNTNFPELIHNQHSSVMTCEILASVADQSVAKRLLACLLAALRANGSFGVYVAVDPRDRGVFEFYTKLGFIEITRQPCESDKTNQITYLGRSF
ncbi:UNVERIFIED_CONTAM: hypothetical protein PYX00_004697 [Menopon gallinae]|uniref:protein O-GlcNAcase n=1 Tax=Menopon gallinae TaxID=328185 RepID=A0AAW2I4V6_9NEOP